MFAYVGSRTTRARNARGPGISVLRVDLHSGRLEPVQQVAGLDNPSFLALNASGDRLYSVHGDLHHISAYAVDRRDGTLAPLNTRDTLGKNPVHLAIDPGGRHVVVSNHIGASLAVLPIESDGSLGEVVQLVELEGKPGPHRVEQPHAKPHHNPFSPDGGHVVVPDKGLDGIFSYRFQDGRLVSSDAVFTPAREASGPRHIAFHAGGGYGYCVNELDSTVTTYEFDSASGRLAPRQILSTLPSTYTGNSRAAEVAVDATGRHVYASNRGHDSIAVFAIDPGSGLLSWRGCVPSGGRTPRFLAIGPGGGRLYALNEDDDTIVCFDLDADTGMPVANGEVLRTGSPVCMVFSPSSP
ncbi:lactonase family protein [Parapusillimonas granuli]|uniref:Lactonase family protein n=1 Tax=Parapusillimonas granuli TaxID=380911 RepID=A0A853G0I5_9BURK|nr:lactonase family protein [Parapusillimonas granuli]MBB5216259.1 6-phosphogluconolactonase (cycloisomerase 2 family) [Parapusillimonas granuli]MEB2400533.1 lactonase family protein [Alcaligenaceae bacterium]NYT47936.1 lactonase family protein [Parapusillimonas granuli]